MLSRLDTGPGAVGTAGIEADGPEPPPHDGRKAIPKANTARHQLNLPAITVLRQEGVVTRIIRASIEEVGM